MGGPCGRRPCGRHLTLREGGAAAVHHTLPGLDTQRCGGAAGGWPAGERAETAQGPEEGGGRCWQRWVGRRVRQLWPAGERAEAAQGLKAGRGRCWQRWVGHGDEGLR